MRNKVKRFLKKPAIISAILACMMTIYAFSYYLSTKTDIFLTIFSSSLIFFVSFVCSLILVCFVSSIFYAIHHFKERNKTSSPDSQTKACLDPEASLSAPSLLYNNTISEKQPIPVANAPTYKIPITYDCTSLDSGRECLIEKSPFVQPNAKRLKSIKTYTVVDTETTGLSCKHDKIIEISLARYTNGERTDHYTTLINPRRHIPEEATAINHIDDEDVEDAPSFAKAWPQISRFFDGAVVVGHNVTFDLNMIGYNMSRKAQPLDVSYLDTVQLAKDAFPGLPNYKLATLVENLGISDNQEHRAASDVELTAKLFELCRSTIIDRYERELKERREQKAKEKAARQANYGWSPLLENNFVFTGEFSHDREKLESFLELVGANKRDKVNGNTDYLVVGELKNLPQWALERKYQKARQLSDAGKKVKMITEKDYITLIQKSIALRETLQK